MVKSIIEYVRDIRRKFYTQETGEQNRAVITSTDSGEAAFVKGGVVADCTNGDEIHTVEDGHGCMGAVNSD
jgi:hypothetical protein